MTLEKPMREITVDSRTRASRPGRLRVSKLRWLFRYPRWPVTLFCWFALSIVCAMKLHSLIYLVSLLLLGFNLLYWRRITEHFWGGATNAGVVISTSPILIAVHTDLSRSNGSYPVIRVIRERSSRRWPHPLRVGQRVAAVALYTAPENEAAPHWETFDPRPVEPIARRAPDAVTVQARIPEEEWQELEAGVAEIGEARPGLYRIRKNSSHWSLVGPGN